ncbi:iron-regulated protein [Edwardsiella tarda]
MRAMLLTLALLALVGCQRAIPPAERIVALETGRLLTPEQLVEHLAAAPRLIVGEQPSNPRHQQIADWLLEQLSQRRAQGSLLLERVQPEQQAAIAALTGRPLTDLSDARLSAMLHWPSTWPWAQYGPLVRRALQGRYPLLAANLSERELARIRLHPVPPPGALSIQDAVQVEIVAALTSRYKGTLPQSIQLTYDLALQQWRDRRMAQALLAAPLPALLLVDTLHARRDLGVPLHIEDEEPLTDVSVLILAAPGVGVTAQQADYVWYSASARL